IVTDAGSLWTLPSDARYVKVTAPLKFGAGVNANDPSGDNVSSPPSAGVRSLTSTAVNASPSSSRSFAKTPGAETVSGVSSSVSSVSREALGASLTLSTLIVTVAGGL